MTRRQSRAFWVIPCQPVQQLYGAQGDKADPVAGTVLMALVARMSLNDGFNGVPAFCTSISQRDLANQLGQLGLSRKAICNALIRLEKRGHLTRKKGPSDGTRRGPNVRVTYRIALLADETTAFHSREPSMGPSRGPDAGKKGPSSIQIESSEGEKIPASAPPPEAARSAESSPSRQTWISPFWDPWKAKIGEPPGTLLRAVGDVKKANPDDWKAGLVLESFLNFIEEMKPDFVTDRTPLTWKAKWRAYTNNGEFYQRQLRDAGGVSG